MHRIPAGRITLAIESFLRSSNGQPTALYRRERSWDFCFNYFQENPEPTRNMEVSCLQLGYYLASWGMLRGSSYLFRETNVRHYQATIEVIERFNTGMSELQNKPLFDAKAQELLLDAYLELQHALLPKGGASRTLVSKVMMGAWGSVPSFDTYFVKGFRSLVEGPEKAAFNKIESRSLSLLGEFYGHNRQEIDDLAQTYRTLDFATGKITDRTFTRAKIIDMFGFHVGFATKFDDLVQANQSKLAGNAEDVTNLIK